LSAELDTVLDRPVPDECGLLVSWVDDGLSTLRELVDADELAAAGVAAAGSKLALGALKACVAGDDGYAPQAMRAVGVLSLAADMVVGRDGEVEDRKEGRGRGEAAPPRPTVPPQRLLLPPAESSPSPFDIDVDIPDAPGELPDLSPEAESLPEPPPPPPPSPPSPPSPSSSAPPVMPETVPPPTPPQVSSVQSRGLSKAQRVEQYRNALIAAGGSTTVAAEILGVDPRSVRRMISKYPELERYRR
jgi:hypothetical protein